MIQTAIILAGGFGTRLKSLVNDLPKPMAAVNGEPFLNYQLNYLKHFGIKKVIFSVGYLADKIKDHYLSEYKNMAISYVTEQEPLGTGGGIRLAMEQVEEDEALVLNGDSFFDIDIKAFETEHAASNSQISLALRKVDDCSRYGTIETDHENRIISFKEKSGQAKEGLINAGVYILNKEVYLHLTAAETGFSIEKDFFEKQLIANRITGFIFDAYFIDIGIPEDYNKAQDDFKRSAYK